MFRAAIRVLINGPGFALFKFFINFLLELLSFAPVAKNRFKYLIAHSPAFFILCEPQNGFWQYQFMPMIFQRKYLT